MSRDLDLVLLEAAAGGSEGDVRSAVEAGGDVNARDDRGVTVLMRAVRRGYDLATVRYLVERGASVAATSQDGRTVLDYLELPAEPPERWENGHEAWCHSEEAYIEGYLLSRGATRGRPPA